MENRDRFGHVIPEMEKEIMAHFDIRIRGDFGNTAEILLEASKDLSAENAAAAAADYGRGVSLHEACDCREAALKDQIIHLIDYANKCISIHNYDSNYKLWLKEVTRARELIK